MSVQRVMMVDMDCNVSHCLSRVFANISIFLYICKIFFQIVQNT